MQIRTKVPVQITAGGKWLPTGSVIEVEQPDALKMIQRGSATPIDTGADLAPGEGDEDTLTKEQRSAMAAELLEVKGVTKKNVDGIIDAGYTTIPELQEATAEQLAALPKVSEKQAGHIVADAAEFETEDDDGEGNEDDDEANEDEE